MPEELEPPVIPKKEEGGGEKKDDNKSQKDARDGLYRNIATLMGFACAIGLPPEYFEIKKNQYESYAYNMGTAKALIEVVEYYVPDFEASPLAMLGITAIPFMALVISDRMKIHNEIKEKEAEEEKRARKRKNIEKSDKELKKKKEGAAQPVATA